MSKMILFFAIIALLPVTSVSQNQCYTHCKQRVAWRGCPAGYFCPPDGNSDDKSQDCTRDQCKVCLGWEPQSQGCYKCDDVNSANYCNDVPRSGEVGSDGRSGMCVSVESTVMVVENGEAVSRQLRDINDITIQKVWTDNGVAEVEVMLDIMEHSFDYSQNEASFHGSWMIRIETESGKFIKATPTHQFHAGETCCSYSSLRKIQDLQVGDFVWTVNDEEELVSERIVSKSDPEPTPRHAIVVPLERIKPTEHEDGKCTWNIKNSVIVSGFVTSNHAGGALDDAKLNSLGLTQADQMLLVDSVADELFLGLSTASTGNNRIVASISSEDETEAFSVFIHSLNWLVVHCTFVDPCDADQINDWFATFPDNVRDLVQLKVLIENGSFSQLTRRMLNMDTGIDVGEFLLNVIERYRRMTEGQCDVLTLSTRAKYLYQMFFTYNLYF